MKLGVLNNFGAGGGGVRQDRIKEFLREHPEVASVVPGGADELKPALRELGEQGVDVLAVNGGDGTLQKVLTKVLENGDVFERLPAVVPLRSGRTNMSATAIGSHRSPVKSLESVFAAMRDNALEARLVTRPVLKAHLGARQGTQYGMFCGVGLIHRAIELTHRVFPYGRSQGVFGSGIVTGSLVTRHILGRGDDHDDILAADTLDIALDGEPLAAKNFRLVIATTLDRLFLKMRPFWGRENAPIRFTALEPDATRHVGRILRVLRGRAPFEGVDGNGEGFTSRNVFSSELRLDCGLTIDGEMYDPEPGRQLRLEADERLRFVQT